MADYIVTACSTCDLPADYTRQRDLKILNYHYFINGNVYADDQGQSLGFEEFYNQVRRGGKAATTPISSEAYEAFFRPFLNEKKDILHVAFSSGLSGSCAHAKLAAQRLAKEYPDRKIYVTDSKCAARGYGLLMHLLLNMRDTGADLEHLYQWAEQNAPRIIHWFAVDDLDHLKRGGRVSHPSAFLGNLLNIKPILKLTDEGRIVPVEKVRGRRQSLIALVDHMAGQFTEPEGARVFIGHGDAPEDAKFVEQLIWERYPMIKETFIHWIGPVIGTHSGPGTIALHYLGNQR